MNQRIAFVLLLCLGLASVPAAHARMRDLLGMPAPSDLRSDALIDRRSKPTLTPAQAANEAQKRYGGGKVLSVDPAGDGYRVKLLRDGDVRVVFISSR